MRTYSKRMLRLQRYFRDTRKADISLVPVSVFWSRAPNKERSVIRVLLSEDWTVTSRFRRLVTILFNRRDITVQFGAPIALREVAEPQISDGRLVRRIARLVRVQFKKQRTALLGPDLSHRRTLINQLVGSRNVRAAIATEAAKGKSSEARVTYRARRYARAMVSDMSYITIRLLQRVLTWFWNRIYDGIDARGVERIKLLAETSTLVYVPCHRSHVDYLVLSYLLYSQGLMIPHVAAGDNLDMPLIGPLLRRGGAFFMRRSFGDDRLYSAVFSEYVYQLFRRGSPSEYFIEGGRSRTGRLLPPRTGLLNMTITTHVRGVPHPIVFVPVNIGYEKLIEASSYLDELRGGTKERESILDVLRSLRLIRQVFGRVHVSFGNRAAARRLPREHRRHRIADGARAGRGTAQPHQRVRERQPDQPHRARHVEHAEADRSMSRCWSSNSTAWRVCCARTRRSPTSRSPTCRAGRWSNTPKSSA